MTQRVELPDGWAELRDPADVTERQRRPLTRLAQRLAVGEMGALLAASGSMSEADFEAATKHLVGTPDWDLLDDMNDALIGALVTAWSWPAAPSADAALDLPAAAYEALKAECAKHMNAVLPATGPSDEALADPESPTEPSAA